MARIKAKPINRIPITSTNANVSKNGFQATTPPLFDLAQSASFATQHPRYIGYPSAGSTAAALPLPNVPPQTPFSQVHMIPFQQSFYSLPGWTATSQGQNYYDLAVFPGNGLTPQISFTSTSGNQTNQANIKHTTRYNSNQSSTGQNSNTSGGHRSSTMRKPRSSGTNVDYRPDFRNENKTNLSGTSDHRQSNSDHSHHLSHSHNQRISQPYNFHYNQSNTGITNSTSKNNFLTGSQLSQQQSTGSYNNSRASYHGKEDKSSNVPHYNYYHQSHYQSDLGEKQQSHGYVSKRSSYSLHHDDDSNHYSGYRGNKITQNETTSWRQPSRRPRRRDDDVNVSHGARSSNNNGYLSTHHSHSQPPHHSNNYYMLSGHQKNQSNSFNSTQSGVSNMRENRDLRGDRGEYKDREDVSRENPKDSDRNSNSLNSNNSAQIVSSEHDRNSQVTNTSIRNSSPSLHHVNNNQTFDLEQDAFPPLPGRPTNSFSSGNKKIINIDDKVAFQTHTNTNISTNTNVQPVSGAANANANVVGKTNNGSLTQNLSGIDATNQMNDKRDCASVILLSATNATTTTTTTITAVTTIWGAENRLADVVKGTIKSNYKKDMEPISIGVTNSESSLPSNSVLIDSKKYNYQLQSNDPCLNTVIMTPPFSPEEKSNINSLSNDIVKSNCVNNNISKASPPVIKNTTQQLQKQTTSKSLNLTNADNVNKTDDLTSQMESLNVSDVNVSEICCKEMPISTATSSTITISQSDNAVSINPTIIYEKSSKNKQHSSKKNVVQQQKLAVLTEPCNDVSIGLMANAVSAPAPSSPVIRASDFPPPDGSGIFNIADATQMPRLSYAQVAHSLKENKLKEKEENNNNLLSSNQNVIETNNKNCEKEHTTLNKKNKNSPPTTLTQKGGKSIKFFPPSLQ
jgi:hypothetical protein